LRDVQRGIDSRELARGAHGTGVIGQRRRGVVDPGVVRAAGWRYTGAAQGLGDPRDLPIAGELFQDRDAGDRRHVVAVVDDEVVRPIFGGRRPVVRLDEVRPPDLFGVRVVAAVAHALRVRVGTAHLTAPGKP